MSLRAMHEASKQSSVQENSSQLIAEQRQTIEQQEQTISEPSSQISLLKSEMQKLADKNAQLSESDLVLSENAKLKKQNAQLKQNAENANAEAARTISSVKEEYERKEMLLTQRQETVERVKEETYAAQERQEALIEERAEKMYAERKNVLEGEYKAKMMVHQGFMIGCLLYSVMVTAFAAVRSVRFAADFKAFFGVVWAWIGGIAAAVMQIGRAAAQLGDKIPQPVAATVVHWLLLIIVLGVVSLVLLGAISYVIHWVCAFYSENRYADTPSLAVLLVSMAIVVYFGDAIRTIIPINLMLLIIAVNVAYIAGRKHIEVRW